MLWGEVDIAATPTGVEIESKINRFGGVPFLPLFTGVFKLKKGTPKELRGACLLRVILVL